MTNTERLLCTSRALPIALLRAREALMAPIREMLHDINLTEQKWRIMRALDELGEAEQSTIADAACLLQPSLTRTLRSMEGDGLIARRRDKIDRRKTLVCITPKGKQILTDNIGTSIAIYNTIEHQMGQAKLHQLLDLLAELRATPILSTDPQDEETRPR